MPRICFLLLQHLHKTLRQTHILKSNRLAEQRGDFFVPEAGDAAADASDVEEEFRACLPDCCQTQTPRQPLAQ